MRHSDEQRTNTKRDLGRELYKLKQKKIMFGVIAKKVSEGFYLRSLGSASAIQ